MILVSNGGIRIDVHPVKLTQVEVQERRSGFAREIDYLEARRYRYNPAAGTMGRRDERAL